METTTYHYASLDEALTLIARLHDRAKTARSRLVILTATGTQALAVQRHLAAHNQGFGITVTTLRTWVSDLWSLYGDGRTPVSPDERIVHLVDLLEQSPGMTASPGIVRLAEQTALAALPYVGKTSDLSDNETVVAQILQRYAAQLEAEDKVEYSTMLAALPERIASEGATPYRPVSLIPFDELSVLEQRFLKAMDATIMARTMNKPDGQTRPDELQRLLESAFNRAPRTAPVRADGHVQVFLASGVEAQRTSVQQAIRHAQQAGCTSITVVTPDAERQWRFNAPHLRCELHARKPFAEVDAGRMLLDLCRMVGDGSTEGQRPDTALDQDYAFNPFSGIGYVRAFQLDKLHRGNRLMDNADVLSDLAGNAPDGMEGVIALVEADDVSSAVRLLMRWAMTHCTRPDGDEGYLTEQIAALQAAARRCEAAEACGASQRAAVLSLDGTSIALNLVTAGPSDENEQYAPSRQEPTQGMLEAPTAVPDESADSPATPAPKACVTFTTLEQAAEAAPASTDAIILAHLNTADYPIRQTEDALSTLLGKWGLAPQTDAWDVARRRFYRVLQSARQLILLQRATHDEAADDAQPAAVFEEIIDCYVPADAGSDARDKNWGLPHALVPFAHMDGEEHFVKNIVGTQATNIPRRTCPAPIIGHITADARPFIVLKRSYKGRTFPGLDVSASQIESYLECPYQWFAKRRLKLDAIDEQFSPLERGSFMHAVLEVFYRRFQNEVAPKVTEETLPAAHTLLQQVFDEQAKLQFDESESKPGNRYAPINALEEKQRDRLLVNLQEHLPLEAQMLPRFRPTHFEWQYGKKTPFQYAGCNLNGAVDRIDIDDEGNSVIIDYKSSLSPAYRLHLDPEGRAAKEQTAQAEAARRAYVSTHGGLEPPAEPATFELPAKMQALIYAKAVRDLLGVNVVASLYLNPLDGRILGAYDSHVVGVEQIPFKSAADARACAVPFGDTATFNQLIDECEATVADRMTHLAAGEVYPDPHGPDACRYCPVGNCPQRLEERRR